MRAAVPSPSTGMFTVPATHGPEAALPDPTLMLEVRTRRGRCCASSSSILSRFDRASQGAQVVRHVAELPNQRGISELAGGWIARSAEGERARAAGFARKGLRALDCRIGACALHRLTWRDPIVRHDQRKRDVIGDVHRNYSLR